LYVFRQRVADDVVFNAESPKPEEAQLVEDPTLVRDAVGHDPIEGADPVCADDEQSIAKIVHIANLPLPFWKGKMGLKQGVRHQRTSSAVIL
jgi:hypothetical protein